MLSRFEADLTELSCRDGLEAVRISGWCVGVLAYSEKLVGVSDSTASVQRRIILRSPDGQVYTLMGGRSIP